MDSNFYKDSLLYSRFWSKLLYCSLQKYILRTFNLLRVKDKTSEYRDGMKNLLGCTSKKIHTQKVDLDNTMGKDFYTSMICNFCTNEKWFNIWGLRSVMKFSCCCYFWKMSTSSSFLVDLYHLKFQVEIIWDWQAHVCGPIFIQDSSICKCSS